MKGAARPVPPGESAPRSDASDHFGAMQEQEQAGSQTWPGGQDSFGPWKQVRYGATPQTSSVGVPGQANELMPRNSAVHVPVPVFFPADGEPPGGDGWAAGPGFFRYWPVPAEPPAASAATSVEGGTADGPGAPRRLTSKAAADSRHDRTDRNNAWLQVFSQYFLARKSMGKPGDYTVTIVSQIG